MLCILIITRLHSKLFLRIFCLGHELLDGKSFDFFYSRQIRLKQLHLATLAHVYKQGLRRGIFSKHAERRHFIGGAHNEHDLGWGRWVLLCAAVVYN